MGVSKMLQNKSTSYEQGGVSLAFKTSKQHVMNK